MPRFLPAALLAALLAACGSTPSPTPSPQPVARVGNQSIPRSLFDVRLASALTAIQQGGGPQKGSSGYDAMLTKLRASVLKSLIIDSVIGQEATYRHIAATDAEVQTQVDADTRNAGGIDALKKQLSEAGGSLEQLRDEIRSRINEQRLEDQFAKQRADAVLQRLVAGEDFATLAKQVSDDDSTRDKGGDMGLLGDTQLDQDGKPFADAVRALQAGKLVTAPVRDQAGYEIVRVDAVGASGHAVHRILVAAPQTYTVKERPAWFLQSVVDAVAQYCSQGQLSVLISNASQPCATAGAATASPGALTPAPTPSRTP